MPVADTAGKLYNVTVTTGSGTSATGTLNQWYWFGTGTCGFSGPGVVNSGTSGPPGSSAYILDAVGNGLDSTTGTTTNGSTTLTDPNASFNAGDVGETINIQSAGPSSSALVTTIAGFNSATSITLGTAASASKINGDATYNYGTTAIDTNCTGFSNLLLLAPMIESLSDAVASAVTGTGAGGSVGGNESWLGGLARTPTRPTPGPPTAATTSCPPWGPTPPGAARWGRARARWPRVRPDHGYSTRRGRAHRPRPRPTPGSSTVRSPLSRAQPERQPVLGQHHRHLLCRRPDPGHADRQPEPVERPQHGFDGHGHQLQQL